MEALRAGFDDQVLPDSGYTRLEFLELRALQPLLETAFRLLGGDESQQRDDEAEVAHQVVRVALRRIEAVIATDDEEKRHVGVRR